MQRFKDFTKKSGKVASAILSAAMVTSMVAGTNVVYADEVTTAEKNVTAAETAENDAKEIVLTAEAEYVSLVQGLKVNAVSPDDTTAKAFTNAEAAVEAKYGVEITATLDAKTALKKAPSDVEKGERDLKVTVNKKNADGSTGFEHETTVPYTLAKLTDRAAEMKTLAQTELDKFVPNNASGEDDAIKGIEDILNEETDGIKPYGDVKVEATSATGTGATEKTEGSFATQVTLKISDGTTEDKATEVIDYKKAIAKSEDRVTDAKAAVTKYLENAKYIDNSMIGATTVSDFEKIVNNYLKDNGYADVKIDSTLSTVNTTVTDVTKATKDADGEATTSFALVVLDKVGNAKTAATEVKNQKITLLSAQTKVDSALAELTEIANGIEVTAATDTNSYEEAFNKGLKKAYNTAPTALSQDSSDVKINNATKEIDNITKVYAGVKADVTFGSNLASPSADGKQKVVITVASTDNPEIRDTYEKVYTLDSAQSAVDKAKLAVETALDGMTFTKTTTKADVEAVVAEAVKPYSNVETVVSFVPGDNTVSVGVTLTKTTDGVTKKATVEKTYSLLAGFVEKDGKKYFYDANGELVKNRYIQADESGDGFTYFAQNDGSIMQDRLSYDPTGKDVIYFDADGHMAFDKFINVKKDVAGNAVDYIGYFDTFGRAYVNQTTYGNGEGAYAADALFYINDYGVLENKGWFKNAAGEIGYAATNGTLTTSQWSLDQFGRKVYFQANGFLAKGLMTDGVKYYQLDETDGHLVGEF